MKTFAIYNLGCRVNAAETNLFAQSLLNQGYSPDQNNPDTIFINTCSITKKANVESLGLIRRLQKKYSKAKIIISGCANLKNIYNLKNISILDNQQKEAKLLDLNSAYTPKIKDKFSHTHRYLLKIQSGCTTYCSYCTVPFKRPYLWSLPIKNAIDTVNNAVTDGYKEVIITGVNLNQYTPGLSNLVETLLDQTKISLISFGSIPINCIDKKFVSLYSGSLVKGSSPTSSRGEGLRLSSFLHIPIQSGSNKILKLMNRNYTKEKIINVFNSLKNISSPLLVKGGVGDGFSLGTDIIVGFPTETDTDFQKTYNLCKKIGFTKIHVFKYSPRPNTKAQELFFNSPKISKQIIKERSQKIRSLISQTKLPSHQKREKKN